MNICPSRHLLCHPSEQQRTIEKVQQGVALGCCCPSKQPCFKGHDPLCPFPPYPLTSLPFRTIRSLYGSHRTNQPFPQRAEVGGEQGTAKKQAPVTPQRMESPKGHVAFMPHLGDNASLAVLSRREHLASELLMLSFAVAAKPQMALETSCCEGCTYFSQLPKNRAQCGEAHGPGPAKQAPLA